MLSASLGFPRHRLRQPGDRPAQSANPQPSGEFYTAISSPLHPHVTPCHFQMEAVCAPCWTCRNRRIQCDQSGTPCAKCEKAGVECFDKRPLRWVKGVAIRGKMQGHSYERTLESSRVKTSGIVKSVRSLPKKLSSAVVQASASSRSLPFTLQDPSTSNLDQVSKYYIDYCKIGNTIVR
jgi:hypothetical protein